MIIYNILIHFFIFIIFYSQSIFKLFKFCCFYLFVITFFSNLHINIFLLFAHFRYIFGNIFLIVIFNFNSIQSQIFGTFLFNLGYTFLFFIFLFFAICFLILFKSKQI